MCDSIIEDECREDLRGGNNGEDWVRDTAINTFFKALADYAEKHDLSEEEISKLISGVLKRGIIEETYTDLIDSLSHSLAETMESTMYERVLEARAFTAEFLARQEQKWGKAFVSSEALYLCILEATDNYNKFVAAGHAGEQNYTYYALKHIHGRALQMYKEILCLNQNGFADGAFARWRSLYELSVVACFIKKYGESIAEAYTNSVNTTSGASRANEWARSAPCFAKKKPKDCISFQDLIDNCDIDLAWRSEYKFSNLFVHSSAEGTFFRLGAAGSTESIPVGHTDWGMTLSATYAANSLVLITIELFSIFTHGDSIAAGKTFFAWLERIEKYYKDVEDQCFPDFSDANPEDS